VKDEIPRGANYFRAVSKASGLLQSEKTAPHLLRTIGREIYKEKCSNSNEKGVKKWTGQRSVLTATGRNPKTCQCLRTSK